MIIQSKGKYYVLDDTPSISKFRLLSITVLVDKDKLVDIDLSCDNDSNLDESLCQFSLLIGVNGVGKSTILRSLIDFFIDFKAYNDAHLIYHEKLYRRCGKKYLQVVEVKYTANDYTYRIWKNDNERRYYVNDSDSISADIPLPNIVASCFGIFDKFPIKNPFSSSVMTSKYNVQMYNYVGAKTANNIFSTVSSIFQMLYYLLGLEKLTTILKVRDLLKYMGYDDRLAFICKLRQYGSINSFEDFLSLIQRNSKTNTRRQWYFEKFLKLNRLKQQSLYNSYKSFVAMSIGSRKECRYDFEFNENNVQTSKDDIRNLYQLRQLGLVMSIDCFLFKNGQKINCNDISSGELNLFCTVVGALSASEKENALILIDEPELSQHPNWQMSIIDFLNEGLSKSACHMVIATHSHFLVSDLPKRKSSVTYLSRKNGFHAEKIMEDTYGWSAEEVLLKVFKVPTTRNIYLSKIVGDLLDRIAKGDIERQDVLDDILFLEEVYKNMNEVDPMKKIIETIIKTYRHEN